MSSCHLNLSSGFSSRNRNYMLKSHRKDDLLEWMKAMLHHSFVLDSPETYIGTMSYFEDMIEEHRRLGSSSKLCQYVPTVGKFHTPLMLVEAFKRYDEKYSISKRKFVAPTFNEIRHILNLSQIMAIGTNLKMISFDGDQTLYQDGGNFEGNDELASGILTLLCQGVKVVVTTAAGYGLDGSKYQKRLQGLLTHFEVEKLTKEQVENFFVMGGECNYLVQCTLDEVTSDLGLTTTVAALHAVPVEKWQAEHLDGPKPFYWEQSEVNRLIDLAEATMTETVAELRLRAKILRKDRSIGVYPGGKEMELKVPVGHGTNKIKREALDELALRLMDKVRMMDPPLQVPYCVFNGGTDAWLDVGNKSVGVAALQAYFGLAKEQCLHVGDQFLQTGNDIAAREVCPCIWIINPRETGKILHHILRYMNSEAMVLASTKSEAAASPKGKMNIYTGITF